MGLYTMKKNKTIIGFLAILIANFMAMFLISGIGVLGYAVAGEYNALMSVSMIFTLESAARCAIMPLSGKLGEKFGRKQLFVFALILYTASYAVATFVPNFWMYVIARTVSGVAWGLWVTNSFVLMNDVFGSQDATKFSGFAQSASTIAMMIAAPLAGIFCATSAGWRLEYYISLPILVITIILAIIGIPKNAKSVSEKPMDIGGSIFTCVFLIPFGLVMSWGPTNGWTTPLNMTLIIIAVLGIILLLISEKRSQDPIFPVRILKNKYYLSIFIIGLFFSIANAAFNYLPSYVQAFGGVDPVRAGFLTTPSLIVAAILTIIFGQYAAKTSKYRPLVLIWAIASLGGGVLLFMTGMPIVAGIPFAFGMISILPMGSVNSCQQIVPYTYPLNVLKPEELASGMAFLGVSGIFGNTIANGLMGAIINTTGMVNCFKVPLICAVVMTIFAFMFKDVKKGETL